MMYAAQASPEFQVWFGERLASLTEDVRKSVGDNLIALVLGGGYGRGEGGVVCTNGREMPYNDIDLTIIVNEPTRVDQHGLKAIGHNAFKSLGIEVDFSRPLAPGDVQNWPNSLMWHDLLNGHIVLSGDTDILRRLAPPEMSKQITSTEALRLLLNRGSGLLWAMSIARGGEIAPDPDFVRRNAYKCILALGDAILINKNKYNTQYTGRDGVLDEICRTDAGVDCLHIQDKYKAALTFKFTPDLAPEIQTDIEGLRLIAECWISVFLYTENQRYSSKKFGTIDEYMNWAGIREPEQNGPARWLKNAVQNIMLYRISVLYPRERLYCMLPELLTAERSIPADWQTRVQVYMKIWKRYN